MDNIEAELDEIIKKIEDDEMLKTIEVDNSMKQVEKKIEAVITDRTNPEVAEVAKNALKDAELFKTKLLVFISLIIITFTYLLRRNITCNKLFKTKDEIQSKIKLYIDLLFSVGVFMMIMSLFNIKTLLFGVILFVTNFLITILSIFIITELGTIYYETNKVYFFFLIIFTVFIMLMEILLLIAITTGLKNKKT